RNMPKVQHIFRIEKFLLHGWNEICAAGQDADFIWMVGQQSERFFQSAGQQQLELGKAQSSPPASNRASFRAGSSACLFGPLPLNHNEPPCSRNASGEVGSIPSVKLIGLAFFFARNAASTRSGVNGASRNRTPTAS